MATVQRFLSVKLCGLAKTCLLVGTQYRETMATVQRFLSVRLCGLAKTCLLLGRYGI